ncbi:hypothetical protein V2J09_013320 [Rumex salicifolius]
MNPYQAWHGRVPKVQHFRVFGCVAHIKVVTPHIPKLADKSVQAVLLGYEEGSKAYRLLDPRRNKVMVSRDVIFEEEKSWCWSKDGEKENAPGTNREIIHNFKEEMKQKFEMSDLGLLSYYLGIEVKQGEGSISLCQSGYAKRILEKMGMEECNPCHVPMEPRNKISKYGNGDPPVDDTLYRSVIGSLRYLVHTSPDLAYSVGVLSRYMEAPTTTHMNVVKQILRYVKGTLNLGCFYVKKQPKEELIGYSDSDLIGDIDDRKSTTGVIYFLGRNPITWVSQKQRVVALSSCEAEYIAATTGACQGVWLGRILCNLRGDDQLRAELKIDNKSAIALAKNLVHHDRSKHIDTRYHFIRECVQNGDIRVEYVNTEVQLADILTKPLGRQRFMELRGKIGMKEIKKGCGKQV